MSTEIELDKTVSLCPECLELLPAKVFEREGKVYIRKKCEKHGEVEEIYWADAEMYRRARRFAMKGRGLENPHVDKDDPVCPKDCGLCKLHENHSGLTNVVVTNRCDLSCWYCFFFAEKAGYVYEPSIEQIVNDLKKVREEKPISGNAVQLTGGEPLMREDLVELVREVKKLGFSHVQLNTDGIKLSNDLKLAGRLRDAGINTLYLSFDGVDEKTNPKNHWEIPGVLENCRKSAIGLVLVPTIIKGVNDHQIGDIVKFALKNVDVVRGINFQPVSLVGRISKAGREKFRITIPDVIHKIEAQTDGMFVKDDFYPVPSIVPFSQFAEAIVQKPQYDMAAHFACGMATYVFKDGGEVTPITRFVNFDALHVFLKEQAEKINGGKSRLAAGAELLLKLGYFIDKDKQPKGLKFGQILYDVIVKHNYRALGDFHHKSMFIGMMHFQDLYNWDIKRVKKCCIHYATPEGVIPFCTFNVIPQWYRDKIQKQHAISIEEWEAKTGRTLAEDKYVRESSG